MSQQTLLLLRGAPMLRSRLSTAAALLLVVACGGDPASPTPPPPGPPAPPTGGAVLVDTAFTSGTITISSGALAGTKLVIPPGALPGSATWRLEQVSSASWPKRGGVNPVGTALRISGSGRGVAGHPMRLTLPAPAVAGSRLFVMVRNPATGGYEVLPTYSESEGFVTALFSHFDGGTFGLAAAGAGGASLQMTSGKDLAGDVLPSGYDVFVSVNAISQADLDKDVDTGFRPGLDDWDYRPIATAYTEETSFGNVINAMAYFGTTPDVGRLFNKYREAPGAEFSNRVGLQWAAATANLDLTDRFDVAASTLASTVPVNLLDQVLFGALKANLLITKLPQLFAAIVPATGGSTGGYSPMIAYQATGGSIKVADPHYPGGTTRSVPYANGAFTRVPVGNVGGADVIPSGFAFVAMGNLIKMGAIAPIALPQIKGRTFPNSPSLTFPQLQVKARTGFVEDTIVYLTDTTRLWIECPQCVGSLSSSLGSGKVQPFHLYSGSTTFTQAATGLDMGTKISLTEPTDARIGLLVAQGVAPGGELRGWTDWIWIRLKKWVLDVTVPTSVTIGTPASLSVAVRGPTVTGHRFKWEVQTGTGIETHTTAPGEPAMVAFTAAGTHDYTLTMERTADGRGLAIARGTVTVGNALPVWRITSVALDHSTPPTPAELDDFDRNWWQQDLQRWQRIQSGAAQGALMILAQDQTVNGVAMRKGVYVLDGASITPTTLAQQLTLPTEFEFLALPVGGQIRTAWHSYQVPSPQTTTQPGLNEQYVTTGTFSNGTIAGRNWFTKTIYNANPPYHFPRYLRLADVSFNGATTATGTIQYIARKIDFGAPPFYESKRFAVTATFVATRIQ